MVQQGKQVVEYQVVQASTIEEERQKEEELRHLRAPVYEKLRAFNITKETKDFCIWNSKLYKKNGEGLLIRCVGE